MLVVVKPQEAVNAFFLCQAEQIPYTGISIFTPIPGTALYRQYEKRLLTTEPEKWDFMHLVVPPVLPLLPAVRHF